MTKKEYEPYKSGAAPYMIIVRLANKNSYNLCYSQLHSSFVERLEDKETGKQVFRTRLATPALGLELFFVNFDSTKFDVFQKDFASGKIAYIDEFSGDAEETDEPLIKVRELYFQEPKESINS